MTDWPIVEPVDPPTSPSLEDEADLSEWSATGDASPVAVAARRRRRRMWWWHAVRIAVVLALVVVGFEVVTGRREELEGATALLDDLKWTWIALAVPAELASVVAFASIERRMLRAGGLDIGLVPLTGVALAGNSIQNSLPGGVAWASVFAFHQFRIRGADDVLAAWTMVAVEILSAAALAGMAATGVILAGNDAATLDLAGVILGVLLLAVAVAALVRRRKGEIPVTLATWVIGVCQRVAHRPEGDPHDRAVRVWERLTAVTPSRRDWIVGLVWASVNWIADCVCLALSFLAVGSPIPWRALLLAYGAGQLAANLPITPGGLGVVEGSLAVALVAYGGSEESTIAAVLLYRVISFWAMLPLGWGAWAVLTVQARKRAAAEVSAP